MHFIIFSFLYHCWLKNLLLFHECRLLVLTGMINLAQNGELHCLGGINESSFVFYDIFSYFFCGTYPHSLLHIWHLLYLLSPRFSGTISLLKSAIAVLSWRLNVPPLSNSSHCFNPTECTDLTAHFGSAFFRRLVFCPTGNPVMLTTTVNVIGFDYLCYLPLD